MPSSLIREKFECLLSNSPNVPFNICKAEKSIVSSPYPDHILNLETIDESSTELAILLQELRPYEAYLDLPYDQAFNWSTILSKLSPTFPATEFYIVVFRSCLAPSSVNSKIFAELHSLDELAHLEASESGGLLKYWFGVSASDRRNLATCIWIARDWALKASRLPHHAKASAIVWRGVYESWTVEQYNLNVGGGKQWAIEKIQ